jgi:hypothetical protein
MLTGDGPLTITDQKLSQNEGQLRPTMSLGHQTRPTKAGMRPN